MKKAKLRYTFPGIFMGSARSSRISLHFLPATTFHSCETYLIPISEPVKVKFLLFRAIVLPNREGELEKKGGENFPELARLSTIRRALSAAMTHPGGSSAPLTSQMLKNEECAESQTIPQP